MSANKQRHKYKEFTLGVSVIILIYWLVLPLHATLIDTSKAWLPVSQISISYYNYTSIDENHNGVVDYADSCFGENDTLQTVTDRGSITTHAITVGGLTSNGAIISKGNLVVEGNAQLYENLTVGERIGIGTSSPTGIVEIAENSSKSVIYHTSTAPPSTDNQLIFVQRLNTTVGQRDAFILKTSFTEINDVNRTSLVEFKTIDGGKLVNGDLPTVMALRGNKIGVNTTTPEVTLDVAGTAHLRGSVGQTGLYVNGEGKVGIGTITPQGALDIYGGSNIPIYTHRTSAGSALYAIGEGIELQNIAFAFDNLNSQITPFAQIVGRALDKTAGGEKGALSFSIKDNGILQEKMRIDSKGNVGIGTTSPLAKLHVVGDANVTSGGSSLVVTSSGDIIIYLDEHSLEAT